MVVAAPHALKVPVRRHSMELTIQPARSRASMKRTVPSHANQRAAAFYAGGIVLCNGTRRSVLDDFRPCGTKDISDFDPDVDPTDDSRKPDTTWTNPAFDRPLRSDGKALAAELLTKLAAPGLQKQAKLVLMHDRAFRPTTRPDPAVYTRELEVLIQELKAAGVSFDKMSSY